jgi:hypothetical protein
MKFPIFPILADFADPILRVSHGIYILFLPLFCFVVVIIFCCSNVVISIVKGLQTPYKPEHGLKYGLEISERHSTTSAVVSARCSFCVKVGHATSKSSSRKCARTENVQQYKLPFRNDNMKKHAEQQHPEAFAEYSGLDDAEKNTYFDALVARNNTLHAHFDGGNTLRFVINKDIVDVIIGDILFDPDDVDASPTRARALEIFKLFEDADRTDGAGGADVNIEAYEVKIASSRCFDLVLGYVSCGSSFRTTSRLVDFTKSVSRMGCFSGCTEGKIAMYRRVICAANLQKLSEMLSKCGVFAVALDVGSKQGTSYLDFRVRFCYAGVLHNFHVLAIPFYYHKTAEIIKNSPCKALDVLYADWRARLIAVSTDGE